MQRVARPDRFAPGDLAAGANDAAGDRQSAANQKTHGDRRRVPAARREALEERIAGGLFVEMKRLRIEFAREGLDLVGGERSRTAGETLTDDKIVKVQCRLCRRDVAH